MNPRADAVVLISDILTSMRVKVPLEATTKEEVLAELVDVLAQGGCLHDSEEVLRVVREREQVLSTGIGHGVALPHGKSDVCAELVIAAGVTRDGIEFDALDAEPVRLVFLLVGPLAAAGPHIKALSQISHLVRRAPVRDALIHASDAESFLRVLRDAEGA